MLLLLVLLLALLLLVLVLLQVLVMLVPLVLQQHCHQRQVVLEKKTHSPPHACSHYSLHQHYLLLHACEHCSLLHQTPSLLHACCVCCVVDAAPDSIGVARADVGGADAVAAEVVGLTSMH